MFSLRNPLYHIDQVPDVFKEVFIFSGYRHPKSSFTQCILSAFVPNNETLNIWTHFLPTVYFFWRLFQAIQTEDFMNDPYTWPLLILMLNCCAYPLASALAHVFNTMSVRARHICFFVDYASLSTYSYAACTAYMAYSIPTLWIGTWATQVFLPGAIVISMICTIFSCISRFLDGSEMQQKAFRLVAFVLTYSYVCIPMVHRILYCNQDYSTCQSNALYGQYCQFAMSITAVMLYASHVPERLVPGKFDIIGHSHQLFHIFTAGGSVFQLNAVIVDMKERRNYMLANHEIPSFHWTITMMAVVFLLDVALVSFFAYKMFQRYPKDQGVIMSPCCSQKKITQMDPTQNKQKANSSTSAPTKESSLKKKKQ